MDISIIIVNYNVRHFIDQAIRSVEGACSSLETEIFVVDNNSNDGSQVHLSDNFAHHNLILNDENLGFSKANNQAIRKAKGKYILLLNPDTVMSEETLIKCYAKMEADLDIGALGVKMVDGSGKFLPESKRGYPTLWSAFCKMTRLSKIAPKSSFFNGYYMGHLDSSQAHDVDVLCGAFMFIRSSVLDDVGLLDESFFMYGEDIDLSFRINEGGHRVAYFPETSIIHYKGESTRKHDLAYIKHFYNAMILYYQKYSQGKGYFKNLLIRLSIYIVGMVNYLGKLVKRLLHPAADFFLILIPLIFSSQLWAKYYHHNADYYNDINLSMHLLIYSFIGAGSLYLFGNYDDRSRLRHWTKGVSLAVLFLVIIFAFLPLEYRPSRALILMASGLIIFVSYLTRVIFRKNNLTFSQKKKRFLVIADGESVGNIRSLLSKNEVNEIVKIVSSEELSDSDQGKFNSHALEQLSQVLGANNILFSSGSVPFQSILSAMTDLGSRYEYRIYGVGNHTILGSSSKNSQSDWNSLGIRYGINEPASKRIKYLSNLGFSVIALLFSPILLLIPGVNFKVLSSIASCLSFEKWWVGYDARDHNLHLVPPLKESILPVSILLPNIEISPKECHRINSYYAINYSVRQDIEVIFKYVFKLITKQ